MLLLLKKSKKVVKIYKTNLKETKLAISANTFVK